MKLKFEKEYVKTIVISITLIVSIVLITNAFLMRNQENEIINVTGLGKQDFEADLIVWSGSFEQSDFDLKNAYKKLDQDREIIRNFLMSKNIEESEMIFYSVKIDKIFDTVYDKDYNSRRVFKGYSLQQKIKIESNDVDKVENVSREITELINKGVEFYSYEPQYYYTKLSELKIKMIAAATDDAKLRAEKIAEESGFKVGKLKYANMGVFQIIAQNSNENYSWGGTFNTSSRKKTATITMKLQFGIK